MMIDPEWLTGAVALMAGRALDQDTARALAGVLGDPCEVLPWLLLRQGMLAQDPVLAATLAAQADRIAAPRSPRQPGLAVSAPLIASDRGLCEALAELVAHDVARAALGEQVQALFVERHAIAPHALDRAWRFRIGGPLDS